MRNELENKMRIPEIILKKISRTATEDELQLLEEWLAQSEENKALYQKITSQENLKLLEKKYEKIDSIDAWEKIIRRIETQGGTSMKILIPKILKYAAIFALPLVFAAYYLFTNVLGKDSIVVFAELENQISAHEESTLITNEGAVVSLEPKTEGTVVKIDGAQIQKKDSTLLYNKAKSGIKEVKYNSLITPRGKVYNLVLSDGTKVWLNASSAIKYPVFFESGIRKVFLTGEAYFEVARDTTRPFIVSTSKMEVEVLGTSFNVMAYSDVDLVETTLITGHVKVKTEDSNLVLQPGMQAQLDKGSNELASTQADTNVITSWRFGKYIFNYENLESVMSKLSRWYDVDILFANEEKKSIHFSGTLYKYNDVNEILRIIELTTNVKFDKSDNLITIK